MINLWQPKPYEDLERAGNPRADTPTTLRDNFRASVDDAVRFGPTSSIWRMVERALDESPLISWEEANARFGLEGPSKELSLQWTKKDGQIREETAKQLRELKEREIRRAWIAAQGPGGITQMGVSLAGGFAGSFLDPLNVGVSLIPVSWIGRGAQVTAGLMRARQMEASLAAFVAAAANTERAGLMSRVAIQSLEGAVGNALVEPFVIYGALQEKADYDWTESGLNILFGAGIGAVGGAASHLLRRGFGVAAARGAEARMREGDVLSSGELESLSRALNDYEAALEGAARAPIPEGARMEGDFGPIFWEMRGKGNEAVRFLAEKKTGEVPLALYHPEVGLIDLVWGTYDPITQKGMGLAKIIGKHPEIPIDSLQDFLLSLRSKGIRNRQVQLEGEWPSGKGIASVRLDWNGKEKRWLMTAFVRVGEEGGGGGRLAGVDRASPSTNGPEGTAAGLPEGSFRDQSISITPESQPFTRADLLAQAEHLRRSNELRMRVQDEHLARLKEQSLHRPPRQTEPRAPEKVADSDDPDALAREIRELEAELGLMGLNVQSGSQTRPEMMPMDQYVQSQTGDTGDARYDWMMAVHSAINEKRPVTATAIGNIEDAVRFKKAGYEQKGDLLVHKSSSKSILSDTLPDTPEFAEARATLAFLPRVIDNLKRLSACVLGA